MSDYEESCPECGFNQKDNDERMENEAIRKHEKQIAELRNRMLNIKPNNELFIKIMRMQQQIDEFNNKLDRWRNEANIVIAELREKVDMVNNRIQIFVETEPKPSEALRTCVYCQLLLETIEIRKEHEKNCKDELSANIQRFSKE